VNVFGWEYRFMDHSNKESQHACSPLEDFVRDYVAVEGGDWDEIEPQVYDLLLPASDSAQGREIVRVAFDPEALPEHAGAQFASFGTPLIDRLLADAIRRGRRAHFYLVGLNLAPHDLGQRVRRALTLPEGLDLRLDRTRALHFAQAVFWFQATFISDQKEEEILPVALDLHYGREVRHLDRLLDTARMSEQPIMSLPEARRSSIAAAYPVAREHVVRTLAGLANLRSREVSEHIGKQIERMAAYYAELRSELEDQVRRAGERNEDLTRFAGRREALEREERLRIGELRQKSALRLQLKLLSLVTIWQPKLLLKASLVGRGRDVATLEFVWDPLIEGLEATPCPHCGRPTFELDQNRHGQLFCPVCAASILTRGKKASG
jgi:hypothetical protein